MTIRQIQTIQSNTSCICNTSTSLLGRVSCTYPKTTQVPFCSFLFPELDRMQANAAVTRLLQPIFLDRPPYLALSSSFNPGTRSLQVYCCLPYTFPCISRFSMLDVKITPSFSFSTTNHHTHILLVFFIYDTLGSILDVAELVSTLSIFCLSVSGRCCLDGSSIHQPIFRCSSHS